MGAHISFAAIVIQVLFLAVILGFVGHAVNRIISASRVSRHARPVKKSESLVETARARAKARASVRAQESAVSF